MSSGSRTRRRTGPPKHSANGWKGTFNYGNAYHADDAAWYDGPIWNERHSVSALTSFIGGFEGFILAHDPNKNPATKINPYWPTFDTYQQMFFNTTTRSTDSAAAPHILDFAPQLWHITAGQV